MTPLLGWDFLRNFSLHAGTQEFSGKGRGQIPKTFMQELRN